MGRRVCGNGEGGSQATLENSVIREGTRCATCAELDCAAWLDQLDEKNNGKQLDLYAGLEIPSRCALRNPTCRALLKNNRNNRDTRGRQHLED
jgi:hypothetical protein